MWKVSNEVRHTTSNYLLHRPSRGNPGSQRNAQRGNGDVLAEVATELYEQTYGGGEQ